MSTINLINTEIDNEKRFIDKNDFAIIVNYHESYIRRLCQDGRLEATKDGNKWLIDTQGEKVKKLIQERAAINTINNSKIDTNNIKNTESTQNQSFDVPELINKLIHSQELLIQYAEQAGQAKLLTDNLITKENDVKYWQEKYFEIQQELNKQIQESNQLRYENEKLQEKSTMLEVENQHLKQKTFFGIKFGK